MMEFKTVFGPDTGGPSDYYRIPSMITTKNGVVFLNAADKKARQCGTVRLSEDDGETFPYSRVLKEDSFVYSSMTQLSDGNIGVLFEPDLECQNIWFTKFSLDWIKGKDY